MSEEKDKVGYEPVQIDRLGKIGLWITLLVSLIGAYILMKPYLNAVILAALFSSFFYPVHTRVLKLLKNKANLAALISCLLLTSIVMIPLISFGSLLVVKGRTSYLNIKDWLHHDGLEVELKKMGLNHPEIVSHYLNREENESTEKLAEKTTEDSEVEIAGEKIHIEVSDFFGEIKPESRYTEHELNVMLEKPAPVWLPKEEHWKWELGKRIKLIRSKYLHNINVSKLSSAFMQTMQKSANILFPVLSNTLNIVINFLLMIFVMFYFFRDGHRIFAYIQSINPLPEVYQKRIVHRVTIVFKSAVIGTLMTGFVQGVLCMIGFAFAGIPWLLWGVLSAFASLIPVVGTAMIWVPCCLYLAIIGHTTEAVGLGAYCIIVVGSSDNFLRPLFMKGDTGMSSLIAFFSILGGIQAFGLIGVIYGPLIFGILAVMLYILRIEREASAGILETQEIEMTEERVDK
ncbi:MAG: AI-2E family transporter [Lentisphaeria bacterium]|nr:AI-2E family transporter [Lentisphaeria bacterium]